MRRARQARPVFDNPGPLPGTGMDDDSLYHSQAERETRRRAVESPADRRALDGPTSSGGGAGSEGSLRIGEDRVADLSAPPNSGSERPSLFSLLEEITHKSCQTWQIVGSQGS